MLPTQSHAGLPLPRGTCGRRRYGKFSVRTGGRCRPRSVRRGSVLPAGCSDRRAATSGTCRTRARPLRPRRPDPAHLVEVDPDEPRPAIRSNGTIRRGRLAGSNSLAGQSPQSGVHLTGCVVVRRIGRHACRTSSSSRTGPSHRNCWPVVSRSPAAARRSCSSRRAAPKAMSLPIWLRSRTASTTERIGS